MIDTARAQRGHWGRLMVLSALAGVVVAACGGSDAGESGPLPVVGEISAAIEAVEEHYGAPQDYFEISADLERVSVIVAADGATAAEQGYYEPDGGFTVPEPVGEASGSTFRADALDIDAGTIFSAIRDELDDPVIIDFAVQGSADGSAIYDATVAGERGGVLLVLLAGDGSILAVQAE